MCTIDAEEGAICCKSFLASKVKGASSYVCVYECVSMSMCVCVYVYVCVWKVGEKWVTYVHYTIVLHLSPLLGMKEPPC